MKYLSPWLMEMGLAECKQDRNQFLYHPQCCPSLTWSEAHVSLDFLCYGRFSLNCGCLSPCVPGALISPLQILNTPSTSQATSNPQQVWQCMCVCVCFKMPEAVWAGERVQKAFVSRTFFVRNQLSPSAPREGDNQGAKRLARHCDCTTGNSEFDKAELGGGRGTSQPQGSLSKGSSCNNERLSLIRQSN